MKAISKYGIMSTDAAEQVHEPVENLPENENIDDKLADEVDEACDAGLESTDAEFGDELGTQYFIPIVLDMPMEERYEFFVKQVMLDRCTQGNALRQFCQIVSHQLAGQHWLAEITENVPLPDADIVVNRVRYLVEVTHVRTIERGSLGYEIIAQCKFIKVLELYDQGQNNFMEKDPTAFYLMLKQHLRENCCVADLTDLIPIEISEKPDEVTDEPIYHYQTKVIAELVDNFSFYLHRIHRHYDFSEQAESIPFGPVLKSRLTIIEQLVNEKVPAGVRQRYTRVRTKYAEKLDQVDELENDYYDIYEFLQSDEARGPDQMKVRSANTYLETLTKDIIHCHEERDMLAGLLSNWESFGLTCHGPRWPKRLRVPNGKRHGDRKIAHLTQGAVNVKMLSELSVDADMEFLTHESVEDAIRSIHEDETLFIRPSTVQHNARTGLHDLNENRITIEGIVPGTPIQAPPGDDIFVNIRGQEVTLKNLTLIADDNSDGILVVEAGGHAILEKCILHCAGGVGITICAGGKLTMMDCEIHEADLSAAVVQEPAGEVKLTGVKFVNCTGGGVEVQTMPKNELPILSGCQFPADLKYHVVVNQLEKRYQDVADDSISPVIYRPPSEISRLTEPVRSDADEVRIPVKTIDVLHMDEKAGGEQAADHIKVDEPVTEATLKREAVGSMEEILEETQRRFEDANVRVGPGLAELPYRMILI